MVSKKLNLKDYYPFLGEDGKDATLELFLPYNMTEMNRQDDKRPCFLICPGGGYEFCSQREAEPIALKFIEMGFNCFVLVYSCKPHKFPSQILEVAAAVDLIHKNADQWNCDTNRLAVIGFSAGSHLAGHYAYNYDCKEVREYFPDSYPVNAAVLSYPVVSGNPEIAHLGSFIALTGKEEISDEDIEKFSLENMVGKNSPPTFIWHTAEDTCVPVYNSLVLANALSKNGIPYELHIFPYGPHGLSTADSQTCGELQAKEKICHSWIEESKEWLSIILDI